MPMLLNHETLRDAQRGDRAAFNELTRQIQPAIKRQLSRYPVSEEDRRDLVQIVLLRLLTRIGSFRGDASFATWLFRLTANEALMLMRSNRRHESRLVRNGPVEPVAPLAANVRDSMDCAAAAECNARIQNALDLIPATYKTVVVDHYQQDLRLQDIADRLHISESAVRSRLYRARRRLRTELSPDSVTHPLGKCMTVNEQRRVDDARASRQVRT